MADSASIVKSLSPRTFTNIPKKSLQRVSENKYPHGQTMWVFRLGLVGPGPCTRASPENKLESKLPRTRKQTSPRIHKTRTRPTTFHQTSGERLACRNAESYVAVTQALLAYELDHGTECFMRSVLDTKALTIILPFDGIPDELYAELRALSRGYW